MKHPDLSLPDINWFFDDFTSTVTAFIRWDEKAGLQRDALRSQ